MMFNLVSIPGKISGNYYLTVLNNNFGKFMETPEWASEQFP
jgi:hypothetical protein